MRTNFAFNYNLLADDLSIAKSLIERRICRNISENEFAAELGLSVTSLRNASLKNGQQVNISIKLLLQIASAINMDPAKYFEKQVFNLNITSNGRK